MWQDVAAAIVAEFSDLPDAAALTRLVVRLLLASLLGAVIGWERESRESTAGLRTHMLVALGTCLFIVVPQQAGMDADALSRVVQGLLAGIGFIGAGAVVKQSQLGEVRGLTTAAGLWTTAAIGTSVGFGRDATAVLGTLFALVILSLLRARERKRRGGDGALSRPATDAPARGS